MIVEMQIEILNGGQILVNYRNRKTQIHRYLAAQIQIDILIEFEFLCISQYKFQL